MLARFWLVPHMESSKDWSKLEQQIETTSWTFSEKIQKHLGLFLHKTKCYYFLVIYYRIFVQVLYIIESVWTAGYSHIILKYVVVLMVPELYCVSLFYVAD